MTTTSSAVPEVGMEAGVLQDTPAPAVYASDKRLLPAFEGCVANSRHERKAMVARLNTLLASQSFLAIAYATSMASANGRW